MKDIIGSYELCSYPQSLMNQSGLYECKNKSVIARHLKEIASANLTMPMTLIRVFQVKSIVYFLTVWHW